METRNLICINCPLGCSLTVVTDDAGNVTVSGNTCQKGADYGRKEVTNPTRIVTSTVRVHHGRLPVVSVKTSSDIPKGKIRAVMDAIRSLSVSAPVAVGDILLPDAAGTGANVIATKNVEKLASKKQGSYDT